MSDAAFSFEEATKPTKTFSFDEASGKAAALPDDVAPMERDTGRGTINPPMADQPQPEQPPVAGLSAARPRTRAPGLEAVRSAREAVQREVNTPGIKPGTSVLDNPAPRDPSGRMSDARYAADYSANEAPTPVASTPDPGAIENSPLEVQHGMAISKAIGNSGLGAAVKGTVSGVAQLGKATWGAVAGVADVADMVGTPGAATVRDFALGASNRADRFTEGMNPEQGGYANKLLANVFSSTVQSLPIIAFGLEKGATDIVGGKAIANAAAARAQSNAMKALFVQQASQEYGDARNAGFDPTDSAARAGIFGAAEVLGERFGFREQMAVLRAAVGKRAIPTDQLAHVLAKEVFKEIPGEELTTAIEFLADKYGPAAMAPKSTLADYLDQAADTAVQTIGQTALMGAPAAIRHGTGDAYRRANAAIAYDQAAIKGFNVEPPLATDTPDAQRRKTMGIFDGIASQYGIDPDAVKRARETAAGLPLEEVGPFLNRVTAALTKRNLVAKPVDEHASDLLTVGPVDDPKIADQQHKDQQAKAAVELKELAKPKPGETNLQEQAKTAGDAGAPAVDDFSGLSEPSAGPAIASPVDEAAHTAAHSTLNDLPEPTHEQALAGNYQKGHTTIGGLDVSIENPEGSTRRDKQNDPPKWETTMADAHYGYIRGTVGMDKSHIDTFIKPGTPNDFDGTAFVVDQVHPDTGAADEHKILLGYGSQAEADAAYHSNYEKGWQGRGAITPVPMADLKTWLRDGDTKKPFAAATAAPTPELADLRQNASSATAGPRIIVRVGAAPAQATPIELRQNKDGTLTPWHDGHEILDFESGDPVVIPAAATNSEALKAVKDSGNFGRRSKYFDVAPDTAAAPRAPAPEASAPRAPAPKRSTPGSAVSDAFLERKRTEAAAAPAAPVAAPAPVEAPPAAAPAAPRALSDRQAFANQYAAFTGRIVEQPVNIAGSNETATLRMDAAKALRELDERSKVVEALRACIG